MNLYSRILTYDDFHYVSSCLGQHETMYGVPIDKDTLLDRFSIFLKNDSKNVVGCFYENDCVGVCSQNFWDSLPAWTLSNLFVKTSSNNLLSKKYFKIWASLMEFTTREAEQKNYFDMYYVLRDNSDSTRKSWGKNQLELSNSRFTERYEVKTVHILRSIEDIKWPYLQSLLGSTGIAALSPPYNKVLCVRRATLLSNFMNN